MNALLAPLFALFLALGAAACDAKTCAGPRAATPSRWTRSRRSKA